MGEKGTQRPVGPPPILNRPWQRARIPRGGPVRRGFSYIVFLPWGRPCACWGQEPVDALTQTLSCMLARSLSYALVTALLITAAACGSSPSEQQAVDPDAEEWTSLFDGASLDGWTPKIRGFPPGENAHNTFRVEDGMLTVRYDEYDPFDEDFGHLVSDTSFSYYVVGVEYRFVGDQVPGGPGWAIQNSGIMVHSQSAQTMTRDQDFPVSIEVQLLGAAGQEERTTANLCTPGTNVVMDGELVTTHCINSASETYPLNEWVRAEARVLGDSLVQHIVNGDVVMEYAKPQIGGGNVAEADPSVKQDGTMLTEGHIALQSESHPIQFRTVEVLNLEGCTDPDALNYKSYYVKANDAACQYN